MIIIIVALYTQNTNHEAKVMSVINSQTKRIDFNRMLNKCNRELAVFQMYINRIIYTNIKFTFLYPQRVMVP